MESVIEQVVSFLFASLFPLTHLNPPSLVFQVAHSPQALALRVPHPPPLKEIQNSPLLRR